MDDLDKYIEKRKKTNPDFAEGYDEGYEKFKVSVLLKEARLSNGLTQQELAEKIHTTKSVISRLENHSEDVKISTLERVAHALGKRLKISII